MTQKFEPLYDRLLVRPIEETMSKGGILLPESHETTDHRGIVLATGHGHWTNDGTLRALTVHVGDEVLYQKYGATEVTVDGEKLLVVSEQSIIGRYTK